ncbi:hypothetical protein [Nocardia iowensis]|uniref:Uncharacterized protein n=1 Tax=Nocardia iowensis TaxID=204891 RepID=A0ABX8S0Z0_NOCIO|nr:hypothetical protein [Nocardia iowensis]QXN94757.1 hypothetical protein KV110_17930 [Nocardia iowensis]
MPDYSVTWHIDQLTADTPLGAAREALDMHRDPDSIATVFDVYDSGARYRVDLDDRPPVPVVLHAPSTTPRRRFAAWFSGRLIAWAALLDNAPHGAHRGTLTVG